MQKLRKIPASHTALILDDCEQTEDARYNSSNWLNYASGSCFTKNGK